jgi:protein ImuB
VRLVPWGDERIPDRPAAEHAGPYPGLAVTPVQSLTDDADVISLDRAGGLRLVSASEGEGPAGRRGLVVVGDPAEEPGGTRAGPGGTQAEEPTRAQAEWSDGAQADGKQGERPVGAQGEDSGTAAEGSAGAQGKGAAAAGGVPARRPARKGRPAKKGPPLPPWPGRIPRPAPALVLSPPLGAVVLDADGVPVAVSARLELTGEPAGLLVEKAAAVPITGWAGPWPVDERWWAPDETRRRARFQVALADGSAVLLSLSGGHWAVEAIYD